MKNRIALKLFLYFSISLLLFSIIIGGVFMTLFKNHTLRLQKSDLEKRSVTMAATLSEYMSGESSGISMIGGRQGGYRAYLRFIDDIAMTDVWIVDKDLQLIMAGQVGNRQYDYTDLPEDAGIVVKEVFQGKTTFSEGFSNLLNTPTLTVGTPILSGEEVIGALLLHSPVEGMYEGITKGFQILVISISIALILSIILSIMLSVAFTKPLQKMKNTALQLANGNYNVKTEIQQKDEIGELASAIDILSDKLNYANHETQKLDKMRKDFVANISHELRTPVTVIRGSLEALSDGVITDSDQVKSYYRQMLNESLFLERLVNDLLDLSRLQNIDFQIEMTEINLCDVLNDVIRSGHQMARQKNIEIKYDQDSHICIVLGDYGRLRQMFLVILNNAIKFSDKGKIVSISLKDKTVTIQDNGIGISQEDLPYIFDRFYKVNSEQDKEGSGLGLAIAKQIADRHKIKILVNSNINQGTKFVFQF